MTNSNYILSLESSDETCGAAVSQNGIILGAVNYYKRNLHDKLLAGLARNIMSDLNITFDELSAVAVSAGPGSFTGLRISAAIAKGLCFDGNIKFIAVSNSDAYAFAALKYAESLKLKSVVSLIKSNAKLIYAQEFKVSDFSSGEIQIISTDGIGKWDKSVALFVGTGSNGLSQNYNVKDFTKPMAEFIACLAEIKFRTDDFTDSGMYEPMYIQDFIPKQSSKELNL